MPKYVVKLQNGTQSTFYSQDEDIFIGRIPAINDLCINDPSVSRQHAQIRRKEGQYTIYDLKSLNGLSVNGKKVTRETLKHQDKVMLGDVEIVVYLKDDIEKENLKDIEQYEPTKTQASLKIKP